MRDKLFITSGTLGLALAASVFLGCQDILDGGKGGRSAPPDETLQHAAQAVPSQDSAKDSPAQAVATPITAPESPAQAPGTVPPEGGQAPASQPAAVEPVKSSPPPVANALTPLQQECLDAYNTMQSGKGDAYAQAKDFYVGNDCDRVLGAAKPSSYTPLDTAQVCEMYRKNVVTLPTTGDPKYDAYMAQLAIECAGYP